MSEKLNREKCDKFLSDIMTLLKGKKGLFKKTENQWTAEELTYLCGNMQVDIGASIENYEGKVTVDRVNKEYYKDRNPSLGISLMQNGLNIMSSAIRQSNLEDKEKIE